MKLRTTIFPLALALALSTLPAAGPLHAEGAGDNDPTLWPEAERSFLQDGPGLLLTPEQRSELLSLSPEARAHWIEDFLEKDPIPETPKNELREAITRRMALAVDQFLSPGDVRAQILFLNGLPKDRTVLDCAAVTKPLEIWSYPGSTGPDGKPHDRMLVVFSPGPRKAWKLWVPSDSKRALYTPLMEYYLEQWEELPSYIQAVRFDLQNCKEAKHLDEATGVPGLTGALEVRNKHSIHPKDASKFLAPPKDLAVWAKEAAATEISNLSPRLKVAGAEMRFPDRDGQRVVARALVSLPPDAGFKLAPEKPEVHLVVEGLVEQDGAPFDDFRMRFQLPAPKNGEPLVLAIDRPLRPKTVFTLRLKVKDELGGSEAWLTRAFRVPQEPTFEPLPQGAQGGELVPVTTASGADSLLLLPATDDIVMGLWRASTIVTGERIQKVIFLVDGKAQLTTTRPPYTAELRLEKYPTEQTVRAEGYDAEGKLVAADEVILNQPKGAFNVRVVSPGKGTKVTAKTTRARAEVVIPDGRKVKTIDFLVNDKTVGSLTTPPWELDVPVPDGDLVYLTVQATLDDGTKAEAVRYMRAPANMSQVDVNLVEMYVAATDHAGNLVRDLKQEDFEVLEAGKPQEIVKFELVQNLPLTVGILVDTSGSMAGSLVEAEKAAAGFLQSVMRPKDKAFLVSFAARSHLDMPPTDDVGAMVQAIEGLQAVGETAIHDALVHSLYYFRGVQGQRAMVLLSDGDDNKSYISFKDAMEYASRSGVAVYAIGLNLSAFDASIKNKLSELASSTGGRAFWTNHPDELPAIYKQIETELRSRYLVAYNSSNITDQPGFRPVEVKVKKNGIKARAARGYYP
ncbi:MAG TPA: VWA domain-containing protein [Thermoanaerobaculia bacterium]|nr:VWA domain-containing protein [Thermoanaerobaculia bacterium]